MSDLMYAEDCILTETNGDQCVSENRDLLCDGENRIIGAWIPLFRRSKLSEYAVGAEMVVNANDVEERKTVSSFADVTPECFGSILYGSQFPMFQDTTPTRILCS